MVRGVGYSQHTQKMSPLYILTFNIFVAALSKSVDKTLLAQFAQEDNDILEYSVMPS